MTFVMAVVFVAGFVSIFVVLAAFDGLVHSLHKNHRDQWVESGCPGGIFRTPQEVIDMPARKGFASSAANSKLMSLWMFVTPAWIKAEPEARRALRRMRIANAIAYAAWPAWVVLMFIRAVGAR